MNHSSGSAAGGGFLAGRPTGRRHRRRPAPAVLAGLFAAAIDLGGWKSASVCPSTTTRQRPAGRVFDEQVEEIGLAVHHAALRSGTIAGCPRSRAPDTGLTRSWGTRANVEGNPQHTQPTPSGLTAKSYATPGRGVRADGPQRAREVQPGESGCTGSWPAGAASARDRREDVSTAIPFGAGDARIGRLCQRVTRQTRVPKRAPPNSSAQTAASRPSPTASGATTGGHGAAPRRLQGIALRAGAASGGPGDRDRPVSPTRLAAAARPRLFGLVDAQGRAQTRSRWRQRAQHLAHTMPGRTSSRHSPNTRCRCARRPVSSHPSQASRDRSRRTRREPDAAHQPCAEPTRCSCGPKRPATRRGRRARVRTVVEAPGGPQRREPPDLPAHRTTPGSSSATGG